MSKQSIFVTRPSLPPLEEFIPYLKKIWSNRILTNCGPFHRELEKALSEYLGVQEVALFNNGANALITALQVLNIRGEVITTPYSFIATAHALLWNNITPVFVDIDAHTLNIDPSKIEAAITPRTSAILAVHCYGHPCDMDAIQEIADKYGLKVIYDAAHAFGVEDCSGSILNYGDVSVLSFHATKVFNTFEGGAIICHDPELKKRIDVLKNFGILDEQVVDVGMNGKMSEVNAAFGLVQLKHVAQFIRERQLVDSQYREMLKEVKGIQCLNSSGETRANYAYFPILIQSEYKLKRDELYEKLAEFGIFARRYFFPLISDCSMYRHYPSAIKENLPVATNAAEQVLCLPVYPELSKLNIQYIGNLIKAEGGI